MRGRANRLIPSDSRASFLVIRRGGALHIAAALGKPILCFFCDLDATRWRPWDVPHVLLQPPSLNAADISVDEAHAGYDRLLRLTS